MPPRTNNRGSSGSKKKRSHVSSSEELSDSDEDHKQKKRRSKKLQSVRKKRRRVSLSGSEESSTYSDDDASESERDSSASGGGSSDDDGHNRLNASAGDPESDQEQSDSDLEVGRKKVIGQKKRLQEKEKRERILKAQNKQAQVKKEPLEKKPPIVRRLEGMLRGLSAMPCGRRHTQVFGGCESMTKRVKILKKLLVEQGMEGEPTMEKFEILKLRKEAASLDSDNILSGRSRRKNFFDRKQSSDESDTQEVTPLKKRFSNLAGIIDSEDSESD